MPRQKRQDLTQEQNGPSRENAGNSGSTLDVTRVPERVDTEIRPSLDAYTIAEFCHSHGISKSFFYILMQSGRAPGTFTLGRRRFISKESAAAWRHRMEHGEPDVPIDASRQTRSN